MVKTNNQEDYRHASKERLLAYHAKKNQSRKQEEFLSILTAQKDFEIYKKHPLFMAGLMLYANGGDKTSRHLVRFSTSDPLLSLIFIRFIRKYFPKVSFDKVKLSLVAYEDHNLTTIEGYWLKTLGIERANLHKTQVIKGRLKTKRLPYGVGNASISNRLAKIRVLEFLRLGIKVLGQ